MLCQQGLQFVPDKAAAVAEMRRVLRPGVAAVSVLCSAEHNLYISALADGLSRHLSIDAGQMMLAPFALGESDSLAGLCSQAGFSTVGIQSVTLDREPVDPTEAIGGNLAALPIADRIEAMDAASRSRMIGDIVNTLDEYIADGALTAPNSAHIATAVA